MNLDDYEEVVGMYYCLVKELFGDKREISPKYFFYKQVQNWINSGNDIVVSYSDNCVTGFSMCFKEEFFGLTEPYYNCEYCYVKPEYRKTRAAYILYNNAYEYSKELGMNIVASGRVNNGVDKMIGKHFDLDKRFITFERRYHG